MDYSLQQLENNINAFKAGGPNAKYYADQIKHWSHVISEGNKLTTFQIDKLTNLINQVNHDPDLKWVVYENLRKKLWDSVYRGRQDVASSFYVSHQRDTQQMNGINFRHDVISKSLPAGTTLFQWCWVLVSNGRKTLYDQNTGFVTVGEYFCETKVPQEQLGINPYHDVVNPAGKYQGVEKRVCCQFTLPFSVDALYSTSKGVSDDWSVSERDEKGNRTGGSSRYAVGGQQQVYIPLSKEQKIELAKQVRID